jgi:hypothetical protein
MTDHPLEAAATLVAAAWLLALGCGGVQKSLDEQDTADADGVEEAAPHDAGAADASPARSEAARCDKGSYDGEYRIVGPDARQLLADLAGHTSVTHDLWIIGTEDLTSLEGLECLREVGCQLLIMDNQALSDIGGLSNLEKIGKLRASRNPALAEDAVNELRERTEGELNRGRCLPRTDPIGDPLGLGEGWGSGPREPPAEVKADDEYIEQSFVDPDAEDADMLAIEARILLRAIPPGDRRDAEEGILSETDEAGKITLKGAFLNPQKDLFVTRYHYGVVEAVYLLLDADGKPLHKLVVGLRNGYHLRDVVGDENLELMISVVHDTALSVWPTSWRIYEVAGKRLKKIGQVAKSYSEGSKYERYYFLNRVDFPEQNKMVVQTVLFEGGRSDLADPPKGAPTWEGARDEWTYKPGRRRFVKTSSVKRPTPPDEKHSEPDVDVW